MSWRGLIEKPVPMPLWPEEWNANVNALNDLYSWLFDGTANPKFNQLTANSGEFSESLKVAGKEVIKDGDPVYIGGFVGEGKSFEDFIRQVLSTIQTVNEQIRDITNTIKGITEEWREVRLYATGKALETLELPVDTAPSPVKSTPIRVRRIVVKNPAGSLIVLYLGNAVSQDYPVEPGEKEEVFIEYASDLYIRGSGPGKAYIIIELL